MSASSAIVNAKSTDAIRSSPKPVDTDAIVWWPAITLAALAIVSYLIHLSHGDYQNTQKRYETAPAAQSIAPVPQRAPQQVVRAPGLTSRTTDSTPSASPSLVEKRMALSVVDWGAVQLALASWKIAPSTIITGQPNKETRRALTAWQRTAGRQETGYLSYPEKAEILKQFNKDIYGVKAAIEPLRRAKWGDCRARPIMISRYSSGIVTFSTSGGFRIDAYIFKSKDSKFSSIIFSSTSAEYIGKRIDVSFDAIILSSGTSGSKRYFASC